MGVGGMPATAETGRCLLRRFELLQSDLVNINIFRTDDIWWCRQCWYLSGAVYPSHRSPLSATGPSGKADISQHGEDEGVWRDILHQPH